MNKQLILTALVFLGQNFAAPSTSTPAATTTISEDLEAVFGNSTTTEVPVNSTITESPSGNSTTTVSNKITYSTPTLSTLFTSFDYTSITTTNIYENPNFTTTNEFENPTITTTDTPVTETTTEKSAVGSIHISIAVLISVSSAILIK